MTNPTGINQMRRRLIAGAAAMTLLASAKWSAAQGTTPADRLKALGLELPPVSQPIANFVQSTRAGNLVFVSRQLPRKDGKMLNLGNVDAGMTVDPAKEAAKPCAFDVLAVAQAACDGDLSRIRACVRLEGFVACVPSFVDQSAIVDGASNFVVSVFGESKKHARFVGGVDALPLDACVEVAAIFLTAQFHLCAFRILYRRARRAKAEDCVLNLTST
jgi:enamine deaminase RidA (YjgF/YER057c/UK114 family)